MFSSSGGISVRLAVQPGPTRVVLLYGLVQCRSLRDSSPLARVVNVTPQGDSSVCPATPFDAYMKQHARRERRMMACEPEARYRVKVFRSPGDCTELEFTSLPDALAYFYSARVPGFTGCLQLCDRAEILQSWDGYGSSPCPA